jgi:hypothetical protein
LRPLLVALVLSCSFGCALRELVVQTGADDRLETVEIDGQTFRIHYWTEDAAAAAQLSRSLVRSVPRVARWGKLSREVTITLYPSHAALEAAVHREGLEWLRAWAQYQTIDVQSPRTWGWFGASDEALDELVTHELTHCVMYQTAASEWTWPHKGIPLWFQEGLASVTADQGHRRSTPEELRRFYLGSMPSPGAGDGYPRAMARAAHGYASSDGDPVTDPEPLYQDSSDIVYGAAHRTFEFLLSRYGEERVRAVMARMHEGRAFEQAFAESIGISEAAFASEFRRYVLWQGWR